MSTLDHHTRPKWLRVRDVAEILDLGPQAVYLRCARGDFPRAKRLAKGSNNLWLIPASDVREFMRTHTKQEGPRGVKWIRKPEGG